MNILVYVDEGAGPQSVRLLFKSLKSLELHQTFNLQRTNARELTHENWEEHACLLIFPGGRDTPYHQLLSGEANRRIRRFVENGGAYLGICAGGYYASEAIEFEKGQPLEVIAQRELKFFPGTARGPVYGLNVFKYEDESGSRAAQLNWIDAGASRPLSVYYNGGCEFVDASERENTRVIARYADLPDSPAAIVECSVGKGKAVLSGVHPEYSPQHIDHLPSIPSHVLNPLKDDERDRDDLFASLIRLSLAHVVK